MERNKLRGQRGRLLPSPHKDEAKQALANGIAPREIATRFGLNIQTIRLYRKEVEREAAERAEKATKVIEPEETVTPAPEQQPATSVPTPAESEKAKRQAMITGGEITNIQQRKTGAILFTLANEDIELQPAELYDAYLYYQDIRRSNPDLNESFSSCLKSCVKIIWEKFNQHRLRQAAIEVKEV